MNRSYGFLKVQNKVSDAWRSHLSTALLVLCFWVLTGLIGLGWGAVPAWAVDYNKEYLVGADLSGRVLIDASFTKANMRQSDLNHSDLTGVSFFGANLEEANLEGANLSNATLDTARLSRANLKDAILEGAFAFNAQFEGANIEGADFTDVEFRTDAQRLLCKVAKGTNPITGRNTRDTLYCD